MDCDDFQALEAALALIDEYDDNSSLGSSSDSGDANWSDTFEQPTRQEQKDIVQNDRLESDRKEVERLKAKLECPGRNRSRDLHKLELLELRLEAAVLQQRVDELEGERLLARSKTKALRMGVGSAEEISLAEGTDDHLYDAWRNLAKKHKKFRRLAEIENRNLRELYARQLKTTTTIKKLFRKQSASIKDKLITEAEPM